MDLSTWLGFVLSSAVLLVIPRPSTLLVVSYALGQGMRAPPPLAARALNRTGGALLVGAGAWTATRVALEPPRAQVPFSP